MQNPIPNFIVISIQDLHFHPRKLLPKIADYLRHPQGRYTGKTANPQLAFHLVVNLIRRLAQLRFLVYHLPNKGQQAGGVIGQGNAPLKPGKELHAQFLLQAGNDLTDAGLSIIQRFGRLGKAAGFTHLQEHLIAVNPFFHCATSFVL